MHNGKHLIAGQWVASIKRSLFFSCLLAKAHGLCKKALSTECQRRRWAPQNGFSRIMADSSRETLEFFKNAIADEIDARVKDITAIGCAETGCLKTRINRERGTHKLVSYRLFAQQYSSRRLLDKRHDGFARTSALFPSRPFKTYTAPYCPVRIWCVKLPLAFPRPPGGDTAAALAAVVRFRKRTSETPGIRWNCGRKQFTRGHHKIVACRPGVFSLISRRKFVKSVLQLVQIPLITASFYGFFKREAVLIRLCAARPWPIPSLVN